MTEPKVSIIIVNWNGGKVFANCLKSLKKLKYKNWELILVDNASSDGSEDYARDFKNLKFIKNRQNVGFAPANNQGFEVSKGKYVLLLNNDTLVDSDLLTEMVAKMESDATIGAMQPKIFLMDKRQYLDNAGSFITDTGFLVHWGYGEKDTSEFDQEKEIFSAKGACLMTRRDIIDKIGLFDNIFVSYFEESDFCFRVWLSGYRVIYFPETHIYHKVGFTSKRMDVFNVNYHSLKNRIASLLKNLENKNLIFVLGRHVAILLLLTIYYLVKFQFKKLKMIIDAVSWNIRFLPRTLRARKRVQNLRKVSDKDIFDRVGREFKMFEMLNHFSKVEKNFKA